MSKFLSKRSYGQSEIAKNGFRLGSCCPISTIDSLDLKASYIRLITMKFAMQLLFLPYRCFWNFLKIQNIHLSPPVDCTPETLFLNFNEFLTRDGSILKFQPIPILEFSCQPILILEFPNYF